jgi:hypothetical protein
MSNKHRQVLRTIRDNVCDYFNLQAEDFTGGSNSKTISEARAVFTFLAFEDGYKEDEIAGVFTRRLNVGTSFKRAASIYYDEAPSVNAKESERFKVAINALAMRMEIKLSDPS